MSDVTSPPAHVSSNLPAALTELVGREQDLAALARLLRQTRLLTLTGAGGIGKTRLVVSLAAAVAADHPDGVCLVDLGSVRDPALVPGAVCAVVRIRELIGQPLLTTLIARLRGQRLLLILDNCEHLLDACANVVETVLRGCPRVRVLATGREALGITGEVAWRVPSLAVPPTTNLPLAQLTEYSAVRLFLDRALAAQPSFGLTIHNAPAVAEICRQLDGIPLALELASARLRGLTAEQIAARLDDRFRLLTGGSRTAPSRQQTLRATIDWSYALLDERERALFGRLAVFAGGFSLEAAEAVAGEEDSQVTSVLDPLLRLVDKSLLQVEEQDGEAHYRLLETLKQFAQERLSEAGELERVRARHAAWCLALAEAAEPQTYLAATRRTTVEQLARAQPDLRLALRWLHERGAAEQALRLAAALGSFWDARDELSEGRAWLTLALDEDRQRGCEGAPEFRRTRAQARHGLGRIACSQGDFALAGELFEQNLPFYRALGDRWEVAHTLIWLGMVVQRQGAYAAARPCFEECLNLYRALDDRTAQGWALNAVGGLATDEEDYAAARPPLHEALALQQGVNDPYDLGCVLRGLGRLDYQLGRLATARDNLAESARYYLEVDAPDSAGSALCVLGHLEVTAGRPAAAHAHLRQALAVHAEVGDRPFVAQALEGFAWWAAAVGQPVLTLRLAGAVVALREAMGTPFTAFWARQFDRTVATAQQALTADMADASWSAGQSMPLAEAIAEALASDLPADAARVMTSKAVLERTAPLSPREREVASLVARGLTNRQVAAILAIGDRTVGTHVTNILGKLGFTSRAQIAAWAVQHGLVTAERA